MKYYSYILISLILLILIINITPLQPQKPGSEWNLEEKERLLKLSRKFHKEWVKDSIATDSLARLLKIPKYIYSMDSSQIFSLRTFIKGIPIFMGSTNLNAAKTISTDNVWPGGINLSLTGNSTTLGIWDDTKTTVRITHQEFSNGTGGSRVTIKDGAIFDDNYYHPTHVAGTMIANGTVSQAKGMAYEANLWAYDWNGDINEMTDAAANNLRVSNHSYGYVIGWEGNIYWTNTDYFGEYMSVCHQLDELSREAPYYLIVIAAGNDRDDDWSGAHYHNGGNTLYYCSHPADADAHGMNGYRTVKPRASAKNILSVGAVYDLPDGWQNPESVTMTSFSGWGPTADGRIKPDICANGYELYSPIASSNTSYAYLSGTSMASPNVSGSIGLLLHHENNLFGSLRMLSSTMKGLIIHTADEAGESSGPDYKFGWGLMNTALAADMMSDDEALRPCGCIREYSLSDGHTIETIVVSNGADPLKATICWTDREGTGSNQRDLINDLDLRVISESGTTYYPWVLDPSNPDNAATTGDNDRDNVEQIFIESPNSEIYTIRISHKGNLYNGADQNVSLFLSGIFLPLDLVLVPEGYPPMDFIDMTKRYMAQNTITISPYASVTAWPSSDVSMIAGKEIIMKPGFSALEGCTFVAQIHECDASGYGRAGGQDFTDKEIIKDKNIKINYNLSQNAPNPFSNTTEIIYSLPKRNSVEIKIYNSIGMPIRELVNNRAQARGEHKITFDAGDLPAGVYYYTMQTPDFVETKQMIILK